jgi:prepilin-type N-terminal cleavage/methylation domain-containing protein
MFTARVKTRARRAFTLLEIMLAVAILGMMALAIYRFVGANLVAVRLSSQLNEVDARYEGLTALLNEQLRDLPPGQGTLSGEPYKFENRSRDEMTWICSAGPGLLTRYASGDFAVTLRPRAMAKGNRLELGLVRESQDDANPVNENQAWVPLLRDLNSVEIRYFDPRLNAWVDRWTDRGTLPHLVRLTIERADSPAPWETVLALRRTPF